MPSMVIGEGSMPELTRTLAPALKPTPSGVSIWTLTQRWSLTGMSTSSTVDAVKASSPRSFSRPPGCLSAADAAKPPAKIGLTIEATVAWSSGKKRTLPVRAQITAPMLLRKSMPRMTSLEQFGERCKLAEASLMKVLSCSMSNLRLNSPSVILVLPLQSRIGMGVPTLAKHDVLVWRFDLPMQICAPESTRAATTR